MSPVARSQPLPASGASRRGLLVGLGAMALPNMAWAAKLPLMTIYKTASCGCCEGWIAHVRRAGFTPKVLVKEDISPLFKRYGVPFELSSCHMARVAGYVVVGHVLSSDVVRLLKERPKALGLTTPGMPWGSPGMERPDGLREPYETLLLLPNGRTRVFAKHA